MVRSRSAATPASREMDQVALEDLDEIDLLLTELKISQGRGNLILCTIASPAYREKVIRAIKERFSARIIPVDNGDRLISDLRSQRAKEEGVLIWVLPETLNKDILDAINNFRELFYEAGLPSLILFTPAALDDVIMKAPDFWRYRGGFHRLKGQEGGPSFQAVEALSIPLGFVHQSKEDLLRRKRINEHLLEKMKDKRAQLNALNELGIIHFLLGDAFKAIEYYEQHLAMARQIGDRRDEGAALGNLGIAYRNLGDTRKAIEYYEQALAMSRAIKDRRGEANALNNLGNAYADLGDARKALECYEQTLAIAREIGDRRGEGNALNNLGNAYADLGDARKALEYREQSLAIAREIRDRWGEANALINLGIAHADLGDARKSIEYFGQALAIAKEIGDRRGEGYSLLNIGLALDSLGERKQAIEYAKAALMIQEDIEDPRAENVRRQLAEWQG